jgi:hypothetical protein
MKNRGTGSAQHADKNPSKEREHEGANLAQIVHKEVKKAFRKQSQKHKKHHTNDSNGAVIPTTVHEVTGWIAQGN